MENVFEELLAEGTSDSNNTASTTEDFDHTFDLTDEDFEQDTEEGAESTDTGNAEEGNTDEGNAGNGLTNPSNSAFAQMRTQNKEYSDKITEVDNLVKSLGLKDIDDFIAKAKNTQVQKEAKSKGISPEVAQELAEIRELKDSMIAERANAAKENMEKNFVSNVEAFIQENKLSKTAVDKLSQDLENDGLKLDALMAMPKTALNRILSSYVDTTYQKSLERKETIKKEMPINQTSKVDTNSINKSLDAIAKQLAGK